ncbi:MAG: aa3-type cytochrome c oxidase subunit IV [Paracoccaceae bacterium]|nr:aa3-type cytochrome c oxidase subunit IV [Paracoccaceae bacterium]MDE2913626.1 aa3-type cytochrome c oxidase subunit IV [Paracoccaceae bacterium]
MADHEHGMMDVSAQRATFEGFIRWSVRIIVTSIGVLVFLAIFNS